MNVFQNPKVKDIVINMAVIWQPHVGFILSVKKIRSYWYGEQRFPLPTPFAFQRFQKEQTMPCLESIRHGSYVEL